MMMMARKSLLSDWHECAVMEKYIYIYLRQFRSMICVINHPVIFIEKSVFH